MRELLNDMTGRFALRRLVLRRGALPIEKLRCGEALVELLEDVEVVALRQIGPEFLFEVGDLDRGGVGHGARLKECGGTLVVGQRHVGLERATTEVLDAFDSIRGYGEVLGFGRQRCDVVLELLDLTGESCFDFSCGMFDSSLVEVTGFVLSRGKGFLFQKLHEGLAEVFGQLLLFLFGEYHFTLCIGRRFFLQKADDHPAHLGVGKKLFDIHILRN